VSGGKFLIEASPGIEFYLTKNWALVGYIPLDLEINGELGFTYVGFGIGVGYGVALYF
jgi:hypothetical protein